MDKSYVKATQGPLDTVQTRSIMKQSHSNPLSTEGVLLTQRKLKSLGYMGKNRQLLESN